jgi:ATP/maltotriose-dependent transcriptional regulator MalT
MTRLPPLLTTKLSPPPARPGLVPRPRLIGRLSQGLRRKLTLLSALAGFGKTTLLAAWLHQIEHGALSIGEQKALPPAPHVSSILAQFSIA